jgi:hypothetical protein
MEDVLAVYTWPYDEKRPVVCIDEKPYQLPVKPGHTEKVDTEYRRNGTSSIFMITEPLAGWRHVEALSKRTNHDWAGQIKGLLDTRYPEAEKVVLGKNHANLRFENTHAILSLYETFPPAEPETRGEVGGLAIHHSGCPHQTQTALSTNY